MLYTAQYRYSEEDRLDITIKGNHRFGKIFAPTWGMVKDYKNGVITEEQYTKQYYSLLIARWVTDENNFRFNLHEFLKQISKEDVTVVCFCKKGDFCHRHLLVEFLRHNYDIPVGGER